MTFAFRSVFRFLTASVALVAIAGVASLAIASGAVAETAKKDKEKDKEAAGKPALVATYGDWSVFQSQSGKSRICYTLAQPKERDPADLKRDPAYAFISERPAERVRNEVSFIMGFEVAGGVVAEKDSKDSKDKKKPKEESVGGAPSAMIGDATFDLLPKGANLWVKNAAQESQLIDEMRKGATLKIKAPSKKGKLTVDTYSLTGFKQAIERAMKDCPGA